MTATTISTVLRNIRYMQIFSGVPQGGDTNDSGVVEVHNFHRLLLAICSETSDRICRIYDGSSVILNVMTLNEPEYDVKFLLPHLCEIITRVAYLAELVCIEV